jgi:hypothetical protein
MSSLMYPVTLCIFFSLLFFRFSVGTLFYIALVIKAFPPLGKRSFYIHIYLAKVVVV